MRIEIAQGARRWFHRTVPTDVSRRFGIYQTGDYLDLASVEQSFRLELTKEFPVRYENTHPVPADLDALKAYKTQRMPYVVAPSSMFSYATLTAFSEIVRVVTSRWSKEQVERWNVLVDSISQAVDNANKKQREQEEANRQREEEVRRLKEETLSQQNRIEATKREMSRMEKAYERELERANLLLARSKEQGSDVAEKGDRLPRRGQRRGLSLFVVIGLLVAILLVSIGLFVYRWRNQATMDSLLQNVYDTTKPIAFRVDVLDNLVHTYSRTRFDGIPLDGAYMSRLTLPALSLRGASLKGADLSHSDLHAADLSSARLNGANLSGADLSGAHLNETDLADAKLDGSDLRAADLTGSTVTASQLQSAVTDSATKYPKFQSPTPVPSAVPPGLSSYKSGTSQTPSGKGTSTAQVGGGIKSATGAQSSPSTPPPGLTCYASPSKVLVGDTVHIIAKTHVQSSEVQFVWTMSGPSLGAMTSTGPQGVLDTTGLTPGVYAVIGTMTSSGIDLASCRVQILVAGKK